MLSSSSLARCLILLFVNAVLLSGANAAHQDYALAFPTPTPPPLLARQFIPIGGGDKGGTGDGTGTGNGNGAQNPPDSQQPSGSSTSASTSSTSETSTTSESSTTSVSTDSTTTTTTSDSTPSSASTPTTPTETPPPPSDTASVSASVTTDTDGLVKTVSTTLSQTSSDTASPSAGSDTGATKKSDGISTSTIIGLSVSGGVALLGIVGFVAWKFTRKRFSDDDFDNEAIKWPDLNAHGDDGGVHAPLPTTRTGGAGFETSSQVNLARPDSRAGSVAPSAGSTTELYSNNDPYAVPPLPHLNPNMPYRDDPGQAYYDHDPYASAAPAQGEAYAMTQINRMRSPAPPAGYGYDGRVSPGPQQGLNADYRTRSPGPAASLYAGRASPGPQAGRMSPGPQMAYGPASGY